MYILLGISILPTIILLLVIYSKDSYEKEPFSLLVQLFLLGVASIIPAVILEMIGETVWEILLGENSIAYNFVYAFFVVALAEEGFKFLFTVLRTWKNRNFNYKFDGIVYTVFVSLGFATLENILYVFQNGIGTGIMRAILSVPGHAIDAVFMGYFYGIAKQCSARGQKERCVLNMVLSLMVAVALHGFYDFCLFEGGLWIIAFFIFVVVIDICGIIRVHFSSKHDEQIIMNNYYYVYGNVYAPQGYIAPMMNQVQFRVPNEYVSPFKDGIYMGNKTLFCAYCGKINNMKSFYCWQCGNALRKY